MFWMRAVGVVSAGLVLLAGCSASDAKPALAEGGASGTGTQGSGTPSTVVSDGYVTAGPWMGYGFTATDPGAAIITPNCGGASCQPPFSGSTFCMTGTVTGRADYSGFAMLGWNLSQAVGGAALTWSVPATGGVTVHVVSNPADTALRLQLQGTNPHDGSDRWCAPLVSGQFIPWSAFTTNCWEGGMPKNPLTPSTPLQQGSVIVPGLQTDLPFDVCLVGLEITP